MTRRRRSRALDRVLAATLISSWLLLFVPSLYQGLSRGAWVYPGNSFWVESSSDSPVVYRTGSMYESSGSPLLPGDRWIRLEGLDLRGASYFDIVAAMHAKAAARAAIRYEVERDGRAIEILALPTPDPLWASGVPAALATVLAATFLLLRAPHWRLARRFFVTMLLWCIYLQAPGRSHTVVPAVQLLAQVVVGPTAIALLLWFAADLVEGRPPRTWQRVAPWVVGGFAALVAAGEWLLPLSVGTRIHWLGLASINRVAAGVLLLASVTRAYRAAAPAERRQLKWILYGLFIGVLPQVALSAGFLVGVQLWAWGWVASACLTAIPAGFVVAVLGHRWLDIDPLISTTASCAVVGLGALGVVLAVLPRFVNALSELVGIDPEPMRWLFTMGLVVAAIPMHKLLRPVLDRWIFPERHERTLGFEQLLEEIGRFTSGENLLRLAGQRVDALLEPESIVVYGRQEGVFTALVARGREAPPTYESDSLLARTLERRGLPLTSDSSELDPFGRAAIETLGIALVVPIARAGHLFGFVCLGRKRSGDIYTREETAQLAAIALRCAPLLQPASDSPKTIPHVFRRDGEIWTLASAGKEVRLRDMRGLHYLAVLLREPGREFSVTDLVRTNRVAPSSAVLEAGLRTARGLGDDGPVLDARARSAYRERVSALDSELADAERCADLGRLERASSEREALLAELESASRRTRPGSDSERARIAVTKAIKVALEKIAERHPELGEHLVATVRRGYTCSYEPDPRLSVEWEV